MHVFSLFLISLTLCAAQDLGRWKLTWDSESNDIPTSRWKLTWDSEGNDIPTSPYFSRHLHVPTSGSGLTLGRGYDMKEKTPGKIRNDLMKAGIAQKYADILSKAAHLHGSSAKQFIERNNLKSFLITHDQQYKLFMIALNDAIAYAKHLCTKKDVVGIYGRADFDKLHWSIQGLIIDLVYRGDYTGRERKLTQRSIVANDVKALAKLMANRSLWTKVPLARFQRRKEYMQKAVGH